MFIGKNPRLVGPAAVEGARRGDEMADMALNLRDNEALLLQKRQRDLSSEVQALKALRQSDTTLIAEQKALVKQAEQALEECMSKNE